MLNNRLKKVIQLQESPVFEFVPVSCNQRSVSSGSHVNDCNNRGCQHQQRVRVRERLLAVLVLEVVFSAFYVLAMTPSSSLQNCVGNIAFGCFSSTSKAVFYIKHNIRNVQDDKERLETKRNCTKRSEFTFENQLFPVVLPTSSFW